MNHKQALCLYDGISFFIRGDSIIDYLICNANRFQLEGNYDVETKTDLLRFSGRYRNFEIKTASNKRGRGVYIGGSLHKFKNGHHNSDQFYWSEFLAVYEELLAVFQFDPLQTDVWVLEAGFNIRLPIEWNYGTARAIIENVIFWKPNPREFRFKKYANGGICFFTSKGECGIKMYDKGAQSNMNEEILRNERRCKRRGLAPLGFNCFNDLLNLEAHQNFRNRVIESFDDVIIFQPEVLLNENITEQERAFLLEYKDGKSWEALLKARKYVEFRDKKQLYQSLINKYCSTNYHAELLKLMKAD